MPKCRIDWSSAPIAAARGAGAAASPDCLAWAGDAGTIAIGSAGGGCNPARLASSAALCNFAGGIAATGLWERVYYSLSLNTKKFPEQLEQFLVSRLSIQCYKVNKMVNHPLLPVGIADC